MAVLPRFFVCAGFHRLGTAGQPGGERSPGRVLVAQSFLAMVYVRNLSLMGREAPERNKHTA